MFASCRCVCWMKGRCSATSLISCALILAVTLQQQQHATAMSTRRETTKGFANPARYDEATRNYYHPRAASRPEHVPNAATFGNYFASASAAPGSGSDELQRAAGLPDAPLRRYNLARLYEASNPTDFTPTSLTQAGRHSSAAAAGLKADGYALLLGESFKSAPAGDKVDNSEENRQNYATISDGSMARQRSSSGSFGAIKHEAQHQQNDLTAEQQTSLGDAELHHYFPYNSGITSGKPYQRQQIVSSFQQQLNEAFAHKLVPSRNVYSSHYAEDALGQSLRTREQTHERQMSFPDYRQQATAPSQLQVQVTDSRGRSISPSSIRGVGRMYAEDIDADTDAKDNSRQSTLYDYQHEIANEINSNQLETNLQHMQQQLEQQQQQFAQLQQQLQHHDIQLQNQQQLATQEILHQAQARPQLPPITTTVHHTPASAAAVAGVPLAKHVQVTKHVPTLAHYQQQHVPYKEAVPIEIPHPVITTVPRPYPINIPIAKTVAVPQLQEVKIPIEKIKPFPVERSVPYIVERRVPYRVEKQVATPYYYPYPIKVPVVQTVVHRAPAHSHHHQTHRQHLHRSAGF